MCSFKTVAKLITGDGEGEEREGDGGRTLRLILRGVSLGLLTASAAFLLLGPVGGAATVAALLVLAAGAGAIKR